MLNLVSTLVCDQEDQPSEQVSTSLLRTSHVNNAVSYLIKSELDSGSKFGFQTLSGIVYNIFLFLG